MSEPTTTWLSDWAAVAQIVTGVGSLAVAWIALRTSRQVSEHQVAATNNIHRAHILPETALVRILKPGHSVEVMLMAKNYGSTPAIQARMSPRLYLAPRGEDPMLGVPLEFDSSKAATYLPPNSSICLDRIGRDDPPITAQQVASLKKGDLILHCEYSIDYIDMAGKEHKTHIKLFLTPEHITGEIQLPLSHGRNAISVS